MSFIVTSVSLVRENLRAGLREYFQHKIRTLVAMSVFAWVAMTLYQDKVDNLCVQELLRHPENGSIYRCFRTFLHGFCLYLILLLLAHLSDMQHRSSSSHVFTIPESTNLQFFSKKFSFICICLFVFLQRTIPILRQQKDWVGEWV